MSEATEAKKQQKSLIKKLIILCTVMTVCLVAVICIHLYKKNNPYISATAKRPEIEQRKAIVAEDFDQWIQSFVVECPNCLDEDKQGGEAYVRISYDSTDQTWIEASNQPTPKKHFSGNDWMELSHGGRVRVTHLMFSHGKPDGNGKLNSELFQLPYREGDLPLEHTQTKRAAFPYRFICPSFEVDDVENRKINGGYIFDINSRGKHRIQMYQNYSEGHFVPGYGINVTLPVSFYHDVGFPLYITSGEDQEFELPLVEGSVLDVIGGQVGYIESARTRYAGFKEFDPITGRVLSSNGLSDPDPGQPKTMIFLAKSSSNMPSFNRMKVKYKDGTEEGCHSSAGKVGFIAFAVNGKPEELLSISFTQRPYRDSFVYEIDPIPGIDKEYCPQKNLLKTKVEYVQIPSDYEFERWLSTAVQLYFQNQAGTPRFPTGYFPKVFEGVTVEEMLKEYLSHIGRPTSIIIDMEKGNMIIKKNEDEGWLKPTLDKTF